MYKLWRRQMSNPITIQLAPKKKQSQFAELLSQIIKIIKKKQQFYTQALFTIFPRPHSSDPHENTFRSIRSNDFQNQMQNILAQEESLISNFKQYEAQSFFVSKTYLYTLYVRMMEIFEFYRQRILMKIKSEEKVQITSWQKYYDDNKNTLSDSYQNLIYYQKYKIDEFLALALRKQNHKIYSLVPPKTKKNQLTLKPLTRLGSTQARSKISIISMSEIKLDKKKDQLQEALKKKLNKKQRKLQTEKRMEERRKLKNPPQTFKTLYGMLGIKQPKIQEGYAFMKGLEMDAFERNQSIISERKKWSSEYQARKHRLSIKLSKTKKQ